MSLLFILTASCVLHIRYKYNQPKYASLTQNALRSSSIVCAGFKHRYSFLATINTGDSGGESQPTNGSAVRSNACPIGASQYLNIIKNFEWAITTVGFYAFMTTWYIGIY